jgi:hypothetical protein
MKTEHKYPVRLLQRPGSSARKASLNAMVLWRLFASFLYTTVAAAEDDG